MVVYIFLNKVTDIPPLGNTSSPTSTTEKTERT